MGDSEFISKGPCDKCGSSDANALYTDGHTHCFACSTTVNGAGDGEGMKLSGKRAANLLTDLTYLPLESRRITQDTARKFGYGVTRHNGTPVQVAPYYDEDGNMVAQKLRLPGKDFRVRGDLKKALPFGAHAFPRTGRSIVVTEGEIDAMTMSQVQGNKWPVVSIACGADKPTNDEGEELPMTKIRKYFGTHREYFMGFEKVVLMFDNDEQGIASAKVAAEVLGPTAHIATLPLKDPNDMLLAGRVEELVSAMWRAKKYQPDGILTMSEVAGNIIGKTPTPGLSLTLPTLSKLSFGRRYGEVWALGAGVGSGKTDFLLQDATHAVMEHKEKVGLFFLEASPADVAVRMAGKLAGKAFHAPDGTWTMEERDRAVQELADTNQIFIYNNFGMTEWDSVASRIRHLRHSEDVRYFIVDNLTSFSTGVADERKELDRISGEMAGLAQELDCFIWVVSHLATPEGKPHEEGGQIQLRHLRGSRGIAMWMFYAIGIERNQQAADIIERCTSTIRVLKDRITGRSTGETFQARYDRATGLLSENILFPADDDIDNTDSTTPSADDAEDF